MTNPTSPRSEYAGDASLAISCGDRILPPPPRCACPCRDAPRDVLTPPPAKALWSLSTSTVAAPSSQFMTSSHSCDGTSMPRRLNTFARSCQFSRFCAGICPRGSTSTVSPRRCTRSRSPCEETRGRGTWVNERTRDEKKSPKSDAACSTPQTRGRSRARAPLRVLDRRGEAQTEEPFDVHPGQALALDLGGNHRLRALARPVLPRGDTVPFGAPRATSRQSSRPEPADRRVALSFDSD
eukprot:29840-Pelagococcus_subviridis.AAC.5